MGLNKKTYVNGQTVITAQNLNEIQDAIIELENAPSSGGTWGSITGTLSDQTDLQTALDAKAAASDVSTLQTTVNTHSANIVALQNLTNTFYRDAQGYLCER